MGQATQRCFRRRNRKQHSEHKARTKARPGINNKVIRPFRESKRARTSRNTPCCFDGRVGWTSCGVALETSITTGGDASWPRTIYPRHHRQVIPGQRETVDQERRPYSPVCPRCGNRKNQRGSWLDGRTGCLISQVRVGEYTGWRPALPSSVVVFATAFDFARLTRVLRLVFRPRLPTRPRIGLLCTAIVSVQ